MQPAPFSQRLASYVGPDHGAPVKHVFTPHQLHRTHTLQIANGHLRTINGLCQILPEALLAITAIESGET